MDHSSGLTPNCHFSPLSPERDAVRVSGGNRPRSDSSSALRTNESAGSTREPGSTDWKPLWSHANPASRCVSRLPERVSDDTHRSSQCLNREHDLRAPVSPVPCHVASNAQTSRCSYTLCVVLASQQRLVLSARRGCERASTGLLGANRASAPALANLAN